MIITPCDQETYAHAMLQRYKDVERRPGKVALASELPRLGHIDQLVNHPDFFGDIQSISCRDHGRLVLDPREVFKLVSQDRQKWLQVRHKLPGSDYMLTKFARDGKARFVPVHMYIPALFSLEYSLQPADYWVAADPLEF